MVKEKKIECLLWSIAFPGFGQILNGHLLKGVLFLALELIINSKSNLNTSIYNSFLGKIDQAVAQTNYQWLMFYPCIYTFAAWDAYRFADDKNASFSFLPFVISAYLGTLGVIYSPVFRFMGVLLGPVFLPILSLSLGVFIGSIIRSALLHLH